MARLAEVAAAALGPVHPVLARQEPGVHAVVDHERRAAARECRLHRRHRRREAPVEAGHEHGLAFGPARVERLDARELVLGERERLLHEDVLAGGERAKHQVRVQVVARGDHHEVHGGVGERRLDVGPGVRRLVALRDVGRGGAGAAHDPAQLEAVAELVEVRQVHALGEAAGAHERDLDAPAPFAAAVAARATDCARAASRAG